MKYELTIELSTVACPDCGCLFAVTADHERQLREKGTTFYCPNGHCLSFRDSLAEKLRKAQAALEKEQKAAKQVRAWYEAEQRDHEHTRNRLAATKGVVTRTKKRIANGVCPCCSRHFVNLERHMKGQHPEYTAEEQ